MTGEREADGGNGVIGAVLLVVLAIAAIGVWLLTR